MHLVFHAGPLGEFMLLMPLLRAIDPPVTVVAPWQRASLAARMLGSTPMDIELFEFTRLHAHGGPTRVSPAVGDLFASATTVVSFLSGEDDAWAANVRRLAPDARLLLCDPRPPARHAGHFTAWHRAQLAEKGLDLVPAEPAPAGDPRGPVVVHPGGSAIKRCWPVDHYEKLIAALASRGVQVRPVFGEVELERWPAERITRWTDELGAEGFRSIDALLPAMREARVFVGNDAGPTHVAAQLGVPTVGVLGPTDPGRTGPLGRQVRCVGPADGPGRIEDVPLDAVLDAVGVESGV